MKPGGKTSTVLITSTTTRTQMKTVTKIPMTREEDMIAGICIGVQLAHENATNKGFWEENTNYPEKLCLIHAEVSELLEAYRANTLREPCPKPIQLTNEEEELADIIIRVFDLAGYRGIHLGAAVAIKMSYNLTRPHKHNKTC